MSSEKRYLIIDIKRNEPLYWTFDENNNSVPEHWTLDKANCQFVKLINRIKSEQFGKLYSKEQRENPYEFFKVREYVPVNEICRQLLNWYHNVFYTEDGNQYTEQGIIDNLSVRDIKLLDKKFTALQNIFNPWELE